MFRTGSFAAKWSITFVELAREAAMIAEDDQRYGALTPDGNTRLGAPTIDDDEEGFLETIDNRFADIGPVHAGAGENA